MHHSKKEIIFLQKHYKIQNVQQFAKIFEMKYKQLVPSSFRRYLSYWCLVKAGEQVISLALSFFGGLKSDSVQSDLLCTLIVYTQVSGSSTETTALAISSLQKNYKQKKF